MRSVHFDETRKPFEGEMYVARTIERMTGTYYPPHNGKTWTDWGYEYDYEPGGLEDRKQVRLCEVKAYRGVLFESAVLFDDQIWMLESDLEKVELAG